ncbi:MAG: hypothetical protein IJJ33_00855, partial [Victivallales bacterium]|nr:hypothetical protein [Victivallales bacterium]
MRQVVLGLCALLCCAFAVEMPKVPSAPVIDGVLDDKCWALTDWHGDFRTLKSLDTPKAQSRFKICHDGRNVFLGLEAQEPLAPELRSEQVGHEAIAVCANDSFEVFFCTDPKKLTFYHVIADAGGQKVDLLYLDNNAGGYKSDSLWESGVQVKTAVGQGKWTMELAIPLGSIGPSPGKWAFNVVRNRNCVTPREFSSFAPNRNNRNARPDVFAELEPLGLDCSGFTCAPSLLEATYTPCGETGKCETAIRARVGNIGKALRIFNARLRLLTRQGKTLAEAEQAVGVPANSSVELLPVNLHDIAPGEYLLDCEYYDNHSVRCLLARQRVEVKLAYIPIELKLLSPAYRNNLYATMPDQRIEAQIKFSDFLGKPFECALMDESGRMLQSHSVTSAKPTQNLQFDGAVLSEGRYTLKVACGTAQASLELRKLPRLKGEVWLDRHGVTHVDGQPFLPFGWYGHDDVDMPKAHLNSILDTSLFGSLESMDRIFLRREAFQEKLVVFPFQEFNPHGNWRVFSLRERQGGLTPRQRELLIRNIGILREKPNLLGYYMADEPENNGMNPQWLQEAYELLRERDPWHPCIMVNWGLGGMRKYYRACDILMPDCYPTYYVDGTTGKARHCSSDWAKCSTALRPAWQMPQVASWPAYNRNGVKGVPPDYDELRSQFFQALIHNAKGFNMYAYFEAVRFPVLTLGADAIGETLLPLRDYMLADTATHSLKVQTRPHSPQFQAGVKPVGGHLALLAVNTEMHDIQAEFSLANTDMDRLHVAGEGRCVNLRQGTFTDHFAPGETHIYLDDAALADSVPSVAGTRAAIAATRDARRKPGNLLALGEILVADHIEYSKGNL